MTSAERIADRIARNREIERNATLSPSYWNVARIAERLSERMQRATYGAVAEIVGGIAQGVMQGRIKSPTYSWIVAVNGKPSGSTEKQIHPECLRQIRSGDKNVISDGAELRRWLDG